jgi:hypothetical protein
MDPPKPSIVSDRQLQHIPERRLIRGVTLKDSGRVHLAISFNLTEGLRMIILR